MNENQYRVMKCPSLKDLPPPPHGKTGWPWTEESPQLPDKMPDGASWPIISIVTPSYNQGRFIEEAIRSVLLQGYPDLEYMVFDGGSDDSSAEIIRKYSPWLTYWVSESDRGQAHAINKGFSRSTGALLAWINSDDLYLPGALKLFAEHHVVNPRAILMGDVENFVEGENRSWLTKQTNVSFLNIIRPENDPWSWHQPGMFVPSPLSIAVGPLDEDLRYAFDLDWLLRLLQNAEVLYMAMPVAKFRVHTSAKTTAEYPTFVQEGCQVLRRKYWAMIPDLDVEKGKSLQSLRMAQIYLGYQPNHAPYWNKLKGIRWLIIAFWQYPKMIFRFDFLRMCRRAVLPKVLLRSNPWGKKQRGNDDN